MTPKVGPKVKYLNFAITQSAVNIFIQISHADRGTINMKHIKQDFRPKACVRIQLFQNTLTLNTQLWPLGQVGLGYSQILKLYR